MTAPGEHPTPKGLSFRAKVLTTMMLVVGAITGLGLYIAQRSLANDVELVMQRQFQAELASLQTLLDVRNAALAERCRSLVRKPRIHAALEDNALDLLYMTARDELRDVLDPGGTNSLRHPLHAEFYRFLNSAGSVITEGLIPEGRDLGPAEEAQLALPSISPEQFGYMVKNAGDSAGTLAEILAVPIVSTETAEPIAALVLGFTPMDLNLNRTGTDMMAGIFVQGRLHSGSLEETAHASIENLLRRQAATENSPSTGIRLEIAGAQYLVFYKRLNPAALYPPAWEVCVFPLSGLQARQEHLRWRIVAAGALMMLAGFGCSHYFSSRLSKPVERLAIDSEENRNQRMRAELALEHTQSELQRSARFSADASHQLKTPVTVLRAGLEELLSREQLSADAREEISQLIHQTYRLTGLVEDLLLLSRMDAGHLKLAVSRVNLSQLIEAELDDVGALSAGLLLSIESDVPESVFILGEHRYTTMIVRNLLENAQKYNLPGGRIRVCVRTAENAVFLAIGNTGHPIPPAARDHIFERFHRGSAAENIPGHGLGLNLARELARLHGGDLQLVRSEESWTEFKVRFCLANEGAAAA